MGRPKKPLALQKGNLKVVDIERKKLEEQAVMCGSEQLQTPPDWLIDDVAVEEWKRLTFELRKIQVIGNLDLNNLAAYCNAYSSYRTITKKIKHKYVSGNDISPLVKVQVKYAEEMRKFANLCGLTIDSRLKAGSAKVDEQEDMLERKFGI